MTPEVEEDLRCVWNRMIRINVSARKLAWMVGMPVSVVRLMLRGSLPPSLGVFGEALGMKRVMKDQPLDLGGKEIRRLLSAPTKEIIFVYFLRDSFNVEWVKIGRAHDVARRLEDLQIGNPAPLVLEGLLRGGASLEAELHRLYSRHRGSNEWFRVDRATIRALVVDRERMNDGLDVKPLRTRRPTELEHAAPVREIVASLLRDFGPEQEGLVTASSPTVSQKKG